MAEFVMKQLVARQGLEQKLTISSAAVSTEELGNPVYPPVRQLLLTHGIDPSGKTAKLLRSEDYLRWDWLIGMDEGNVRAMRQRCGGDPQGKICRLLDFTDHPGNIADPWYTRDFEKTWEEVNAGCNAMLKELIGEIEHGKGGIPR